MKLDLFTEEFSLSDVDFFIQLLTQAALLSGFDASAPGTIQVILLKAAAMAELNALHLKHEGATDVICYDLREQSSTFPGEDPEEEIIAELYLCPDVAVEAAEQYNNTVSFELLLYAIHGFLHLQGEDDQCTESKERMRIAEKRVMKQLIEKFDNIDYW
jgi:probable rRNA maturation factor